MATYAIGDIQGCAKTLLALLETLEFNPKFDQLWLAGDLVNRGPDSLKVLRYIYSIKESVKIVLGNHDLHLLAVASDVGTLRPDDSIHDILNASDRNDLLKWLRQQPLFFKDGEYAMVHAAAKNGWLDYNDAMVEMLLSIRRAGADGILTYFAKDYANLIK